MKPLSLDWETRSVADLPKTGLDNYARHPTTDIVCAAWAFDGDEPQTWLPGQPCPPEIVAHVRADGIVRAWNAAFEIAIWHAVATPKYGWPELKLKQVQCVMAEAYAMGLPGALENAAAALGIDQQKDMKGSRVMLQLARPRRIEPDGTPVWWDDEAKLQTVIEYNKQDVRTEMAAGARMLRLSDDEQALWQLYQRINSRGIPVDLPGIDAGMALVEAERARLDEAMRQVTGNVVAGCTDVKMLTDWLRYRGVQIAGVAKADVLDALSDEGLPDDCRRALQLRQEAAKSSTAKLAAVRTGVSPDGRVRGCIQHHGAHTGRSAGRRVQPLNMPRPTMLKKQEHVEDALAHLDSRDYLDMMYGPPMGVLADCLRGMICAPEGREFVCADFSNIEGRVLAWLAGEEWKLQAFRDFDAGTGPDIYLLAYSKAFHCTIDEAKPHRQIGKVMELALGYGGGVGAFQTMAKGYGVQVTDARADELKVAWRQAHPKIVQFWYELEDAAIRALRDGGKQRCRGITFVKRGSFLWARGPSGRVMCYPYPQIKQVDTPWGAKKDALTYMAVNSVTRKWERVSTYGGSLAENFTQFTARDIQTAAMQRIEAEGHAVVLEVYDEIVVEAPVGALTVDKLTTLMRTIPQWAAGLPIAAEGWAGQRYRKD